MTRKQTLTVIAVGGAAVAAVFAYAATRTAGPVPMSRFTEQREGPLQEHLVTLEELGDVAELVPHRYPVKVAPGISTLVRNGFALTWRPGDPQIAALPAEAD